MRKKSLINKQTPNSSQDYLFLPVPLQETFPTESTHFCGMLAAVSVMQRSSEEAHLGLPKTPHLRLDLYRSLLERWLEFIFEGSSFLYLLNHWPLWTIRVETVSRVDAELFSFFFCLSKILTFHGLGELLPLIRLILLGLSLHCSSHSSVHFGPFSFDSPSLTLPLHLPIISVCPYLFSISLSPYLPITSISPYHLSISLSPYLPISIPITSNLYHFPPTHNNGGQHIAAS